MKRRNGIFKTVIAMMLTITIALSLASHTTVQAAGNSTKAVYSVKQLKKALKSKNAGTIIFRTESYDAITIPSVKAAKNKNLIIDAAHANIKNKAKCKTITVNNVNKYTEAVSGNTIVWKDAENNNLFIAKKKTVNKLIYVYWMGLDPEYIVRNNAKIKSISFENTSTTSSYDSKTRKLTIDNINPDSRNGITTYAIYKFDKNGRIIESEHNYIDESTNAYYKYDKNGNITEYSNSYASVYTFGTKSEYDKNDRTVKTEAFTNDRVSNISYYEYDSDGNILSYKIENPYGTVLYDYN